MEKMTTWGLNHFGIPRLRYGLISLFFSSSEVNPTVLSGGVHLRSICFLFGYLISYMLRFVEIKLKNGFEPIV